MSPPLSEVQDLKNDAMWREWASGPPAMEKVSAVTPGTSHLGFLRSYFSRWVILKGSELINQTWGSCLHHRDEAFPVGLPSFSFVHMVELLKVDECLGVKCVIRGGRKESLKVLSHVHGEARRTDSDRTGYLLARSWKKIFVNWGKRTQGWVSELGVCYHPEKSARCELAEISPNGFTLVVP